MPATRKSSVVQRSMTLRRFSVSVIPIRTKCNTVSRAVATPSLLGTIHLLVHNFASCTKKPRLVNGMVQLISTGARQLISRRQLLQTNCSSVVASTLRFMQILHLQNGTTKNGWSLVSSRAVGRCRSFCTANRVRSFARPKLWRPSLGTTQSCMQARK